MGWFRVKPTTKRLAEAMVEAGCPPDRLVSNARAGHWAQSEEGQQVFRDLLEGR